MQTLSLRHSIPSSLSSARTHAFTHTSSPANHTHTGAHTLVTRTVQSQHHSIPSAVLKKGAALQSTATASNKSHRFHNTRLLVFLHTHLPAYSTHSITATIATRTRQTPLLDPTTSVKYYCTAAAAYALTARRTPPCVAIFSLVGYCSTAQRPCVPPFVDLSYSSHHPTLKPQNIQSTRTFKPLFSLVSAAAVQQEQERNVHPVRI